MQTRRVFFTATLMPNDGILIAGGVSDPTVAGQALSSAEVYAPNGNRDYFSPSMAIGRAEHTATLLRNGQVLVAGGYSRLGSASLASADLYTPAPGPSEPGLWSSAAPLSHGRSGHAAVLLADGRVLVTGGAAFPAIGISPGGAAPARLPAEIYDPMTNSWSDAATPALDRPANPTATLLNNGRVLVAGGQYMWNSCEEAFERAEIYDPKSNTWSFATPEVLIGALQYHAAASLKDGRILFTGGSRDLQPTGYASIYNPSSDSWTKVAPMNEPRCGHGAELLPATGNVLVVGGGCWSEPDSATAEQYVPSENRWYRMPSMGSPRGYAVTVNLNNGIVFVFGGMHQGVTSAEVDVYYSTF